MKLLLFIASLFSLLVAYELDESKLQKYIDECESDNAESCKEAGVYYMLNDEIVMALDYLKKGCDMDDGDSCQSLALAYSWLNDEANKEKYYNKACDLKTAVGCDILGDRYLSQASKANGIEKIQLNKKAGIYFQKSCDLRHGLSCAKAEVLAHLDESKLQKYIDECDNFNAESCNKIATSYKKIYEDAKALEYFKKACDLKDSMSCTAVRIIYHHTDELHDINKAEEYYKLACDYKHGNGCVLLGILYKEDLKNKTDEEVEELFKKGCKYGASIGCSPAPNPQ